MEDDDGLELSLGLSFSGLSSKKSNIKDAASKLKLDKGKLMVADSSFKNFFQSGTESQDQKGKQKTSPDFQQDENFWTDLRKHSVTEHSDDVQKKRKMPFVDINFHKKHEKFVGYADTHGKNQTTVNLLRNSHFSVASENASLGIHEDVAESEVEGTNSLLVSNHEDKSKSSETPKYGDEHAISGQKDSSFSMGEPNCELGKVRYRTPLLSMPAKVQINSNAPNPNAMGVSSSCVMQLMPITNSEGAAVQAMNTNNLLSFGYSPAQLPTLEMGSLGAFNSQFWHNTSVVSKEGAPATENSEGLKTYHVPVQTPLDMIKANGYHVGAVGSSSKNEDATTATSTIFRQNEAAHRNIVEGSTIKPGIPSEVKIGGCGSYPNLPWVSTTGPGPDGRTISGVTYKYNQNKVEIVCACHGIHMCPEKFAQHASTDANKN